MKPRFKQGLLAAVALAALLQFTNPARTNPPVKGDFIKATAPSATVAAGLRAACYDCHSDETRWPWYSHVVPVSWGIARDVNQARAKMNLSEWPGDTERASRKLEAMADELRSGEMPPLQYTLVHRDARLTAQQRSEWAAWLQAEATALRQPPVKSMAAPTGSTNAAIGRTLFLKNCAHCHGSDATGDEGPDLHKLDWTDDQIVARINNGKKGQMTAFAGKLSAVEISTLVGYLRTLQ